MGRTMLRFESRATKSYLVAYNLAQFVGWVYVFVKLVVTLNTSDYRSTYAAVGGIRLQLGIRRSNLCHVLIGFCKLQVIAFSEVLHAGLGLVRSDPNTALMQWAGRTHVLLAIIDNLPQVQTDLSVFITFAAWTTTEIVRYPWYALSGIGQCPKWLTYLRYTVFIVLYPAGVSSEMLAMYAALGPIKDGELNFKMFDSMPISYYSFIIGLLMVYPLLFLVLYRHMFKQRQARLAKKEGGTRRVRKDK